MILDGTMSSLEPGCETNAGQVYKLLCETAPSANLSLKYEAGTQWRSWRQVWPVMTGRGINRQIRRAYGFIASQYRPGDRIILIGYSRGAFAVRSLGGVIDRVGLLRRECATERNIRTLYRHYRKDPHGPDACAFARAHCHTAAPIEAIAVWDSVKALGLRWPLVWRLFEKGHCFHSAHLGHSVKNGFHALAMDETRAAFVPVLWQKDAAFQGHVEQVWFRGAHADVGGQLGGYEAARPLANIPLVWMLDRLAMCGVTLPKGWRDRFTCDPMAPAVGSWRGWGKAFLMRRKRVMGQGLNEQVFPAFAAPPGPKPRRAVVTRV